MRILIGAAGILSLAACLGLAWIRFLGKIDDDVFRTAFLAASASWFVLAAVWEFRRRKRG